jgi:hypothetical protein
MRGYWKLRQKSLDRNLGRTIFARSYGNVESESTEMPHLTLQKCHNKENRNATMTTEMPQQRLQKCHNRDYRNATTDYRNATMTTEFPQKRPQKYHNRDYSNDARYTTDMP